MSPGFFQDKIKTQLFKISNDILRQFEHSIKFSLYRQTVLYRAL